jgi:hypothetical protein
VQLLADGICQQKVVYQLLVPLHQRWLLHPCANPVHEHWLSSCIDSCSSSQLDWGTIVGLMANCNPMLAALFEVSAG